MQAAMENWTRMEYSALVLAVTVQSVARAGDDDWEHRLKITHHLQSQNQGQPTSSLPSTPWWFIGVVALMAVFFVIAVLIKCCCRSRRRHMMMAHQVLTPPPLAPVMSGAEMYGSLGQPPPLSVALASPLAHHPPPQRCYPPQATPYTCAPPYAVQNVEPLQRPSAPLPQAQMDAPPPYNSQPFFIQ